MRIAITEGGFFIAEAAALRLAQRGHKIRLLQLPDLPSPPLGNGSASLLRVTISNDASPTELRAALGDSQVLLHLATVNREQRDRSFRRIHVDLTRDLIAASVGTKLDRMLLLSFLWTRAGHPSPFMATKAEAESIVERAPLQTQILRCSMVYGPEDYLLSGLRRLQRFPVFGEVGWQPPRIRPLDLEDLLDSIDAFCDAEASAIPARIDLAGPESLTMGALARRTASALGRRPPAVIPCPRWFLAALAGASERWQSRPILSSAQLSVLFEGHPEDLSSEVTKQTARNAPSVDRLKQIFDAGT